MWDASPVTCRQLPGIGKLLSEKLLEAGLGDIASIAEAEPRYIEKVTNKVGHLVLCDWQSCTSTYMRY